jgi:hypothetical protein
MPGAREVTLREIRESDAESLLVPQRQLDLETAMMMLEPGERSESVDTVRDHAREDLASPYFTIIVARSQSEAGQHGLTDVAVLAGSGLGSALASVMSARETAATRQAARARIAFALYEYDHHPRADSYAARGPDRVVA